MITPHLPSLPWLRTAIRAAALITTFSHLHAEQLATQGVLKFTQSAAEIRVEKPKDPASYIFTFKNTSDQAVIIANTESNCPPCATVVTDSQMIEPGATGRVTVNVTPSRRNSQIVARLKTDEDGKEASYELRLEVKRGSGISNEARAVSRLAKRKPLGLAEESTAGSWELVKLNVWMDARDNETADIDKKELEAIREDLPLGGTRMELKADKSFRMDAGKRGVSGQWSISGNRITLRIIRKDCPTCDKTWVLEAVSTGNDLMVVDLPDEDEGSPQVVRLEFKRAKAHR